MRTSMKREEFWVLTRFFKSFLIVVMHQEESPFFVHPMPSKTGAWKFHFLSRLVDDTAWIR
jgi:hypothetical protein